MSRLQGKTGLITGATGGIGKATVMRFLEEGANVLAVGRSAGKLSALAEKVGDNQHFATFVADAVDEKAAAAAVAAAVERFGGLDILFANAGTEGNAVPMTESTVEEFRNVLDTNVLGVWLSMKCAVPAMEKRGGGSIIATASIAGLIGFPALLPYVASKHAVCGMVKTAALELGPSGIRVNAVAPGPIDNRMIHSLESMMSPDDPDAVRAGITESIALGRYGTNEEVANLVLFLASAESAYISGTIYPIDGGYVAA